MVSLSHEERSCLFQIIIIFFFIILFFFSPVVLGSLVKMYLFEDTLLKDALIQGLPEHKAAVI